MSASDKHVWQQTSRTYRTRAPVLHQTCRNRFCDSLWSLAKCLYESEDFLEADAKRGLFQIYSGGPPTKAKRGELEKEEEIRRWRRSDTRAEERGGGPGGKSFPSQWGSKKALTGLMWSSYASHPSRKSPVSVLITPAVLSDWEQPGEAWRQYKWGGRSRGAAAGTAGQPWPPTRRRPGCSHGCHSMCSRIQTETDHRTERLWVPQWTNRKENLMVIKRPNVLKSVNIVRCVYVWFQGNHSMVPLFILKSITDTSYEGVF